MRVLMGLVAVAWLGVAPHLAGAGWPGMTPPSAGHPCPQSGSPPPPGVVAVQWLGVASLRLAGAGWLGVTPPYPPPHAAPCLPARHHAV
mgnify:CR=1 FL=1